MSSTTEQQIEARPNGRPKSYDAKIEQPEVTKEDVEARLRSTTESISMRLDAIQDEIGSTGESVRQVLKENPMASVMLAVGVGFVVGLIATRRSSDSSTPNSVINGLARSIEDAISDGAFPKEAAQSALREFEPYLKPSGRAKKQSLTGSLVRTGLSVLVTQGIKKFTESSDQ